MTVVWLSATGDSGKEMYECRVRVNVNSLALLLRVSTEWISAKPTPIGSGCSMRHNLSKSHPITLHHTGLYLRRGTQDHLIHLPHPTHCRGIVSQHPWFPRRRPGRGTYLCNRGECGLVYSPSMAVVLSGRWSKWCTQPRIGIMVSM